MSAALLTLHPGGRRVQRAICKSWMPTWVLQPPTRSAAKGSLLRKSLRVGISGDQLVCEEAEQATCRAQNKARRRAGRGSRTHSLGEEQEERAGAGMGLGLLKPRFCGNLGLK